MCVGTAPWGHKSPLLLASLFCVFAVRALACDTLCIDTENLEMKEITPRSGTQSYPIKNFQDPDECLALYSAEACEKRSVTCSEAVTYPEFKYARYPYGDSPEKNLLLINDRIKALAEKHACSTDFVNVDYRIKQLYARYTLLSVVMSYVDYPQGAGGSCHGSHDIMTFDTLRGDKPLTLKDVINREDFPSLKTTLFEELKAQHQNASNNRQLQLSPEAWNKIHMEVDAYLDDHGLDRGIFIENGKVQFNIESFLFSCADGNFNAVDVPDKFLKSDFLLALNKARQHD